MKAHYMFLATIGVIILIGAIAAAVVSTAQTREESVPCYDRYSNLINEVTCTEEVIVGWQKNTLPYFILSLILVGIGFGVALAKWGED